MPSYVGPSRRPFRRDAILARSRPSAGCGDDVAEPAIPTAPADLHRRASLQRRSVRAWEPPCARRRRIVIGAEPFGTRSSGRTSSRPEGRSSSSAPAADRRPAVAAFSRTSGVRTVAPHVTLAPSSVSYFCPPASRGVGASSRRPSRTRGRVASAAPRRSRRSPAGSCQRTGADRRDRGTTPRHRSSHELACSREVTGSRASPLTGSGVKTR